MIPEFIKNINWNLLREQKEDLLEVMSEMEQETHNFRKVGNPDAANENDRKIDSLEGIINLIDTMQDYAVDTLDISEKEVFDFESNQSATMSKYKHFPNGFVSWQETHYEITSMLTLEYERNENGVMGKFNEDQGTGGLYEIAEEWTDEFEELNKDREWDGEFFDEIESFFAKKLKKLGEDYEE